MTIAYKLTPAALVSLALGAFAGMFMVDGAALRARAEAAAAELLKAWPALDDSMPQGHNSPAKGSKV